MPVVADEADQHALGLLADAAWVAEGDAPENPQQLRELHETLRKDLRPRGAVEEMLVETVTVCVWRRRRVLLAEVGLVTKRQAGLYLKRIRRLVRGPEGSAPPGVRLRASDYEETSIGIDEPLKRLEELELELDLHGCIEKERMEDAVRFWWDTSPGRQPFGWTLHVLNVGAARTDPNEYHPLTVEEARKAMCSMIRDERERLLKLKKILGEEERVEREAETALAGIPEDDAVRTLTQYELALDRQMHAALVQLERLQRARMGEALYALMRFASAANESQIRSLKKLTSVRVGGNGHGTPAGSFMEALKSEVKPCTP